MTERANKAAKALVSHLISRLIDDPEYIDCSGRHTRTYELMLDAATELFPSEKRDEIERRIVEERNAIKKYRPLESHRSRAESERDQLRVLLVKIAEDYTLDEAAMREIARSAP